MVDNGETTKSHPDSASASSGARLRIDTVLQQTLGEDYETTVSTFPLGGKRHLEVVTSSSSSSSSDPIITIGECRFDDLCVHHNLVAADYRVLAQHFDALVLTEIPAAISDSLSGHDAARRFVHLVDCLYEARVPLLGAAPVSIRELFVTTNNTTTTVDTAPRPLQEQQLDDVDNDENVGGISGSSDGGNLLWADQATDAAGYAVGALVSVRDLPVAMRRAASRLAEMTSGQWWDRILRKRRIQE